MCVCVCPCGVECGLGDSRKCWSEFAGRCRAACSSRSICARAGIGMWSRGGTLRFFFKRSEGSVYRTRRNKEKCGDGWIWVLLFWRRYRN